MPRPAQQTPCWLVPLRPVARHQAHSVRTRAREGVTVAAPSHPTAARAGTSEAGAIQRYVRHRVQDRSCSMGDPVLIFIHVDNSGIRCYSRRPIGILTGGCFECCSMTVLARQIRAAISEIRKKRFGATAHPQPIGHPVTGGQFPIEADVALPSANFIYATPIGMLSSSQGADATHSTNSAKIKLTETSGVGTALPKADVAFRWPEPVPHHLPHPAPRTNQHRAASTSSIAFWSTR